MGRDSMHVSRCPSRAAQIGLLGVLSIGLISKVFRSELNTFTDIREHPAPQISPLYRAETPPHPKTLTDFFVDPILPSHPEFHRVRLQNVPENANPSFTEEFATSSVFQFNDTDNPGCESFDERQRAPMGVQALLSPTQSADNRICALIATFNTPSGIVRKRCSATLIKADEVITARHCTYDPCLGGAATSVRIATYYGFTEDGVDYANRGSAFVTTRCVYNTTYDSTASCVNGQTIRGTSDYDMQLCQLDRSVGRTLSLVFFEVADPADMRTTSLLFGYPGDGRLNQFFTTQPADQSLFVHGISPLGSSTSTLFRFANQWGFRGEDGGPYASISGSQLLITGVHGGGETACDQFGARVDASFFARVQSVEGTSSSPTEPAWVEPDPFCQIIAFPSTTLTGPPPGALTRVGLTPTTGSESQNISSSQDFYAAVTLYNFGLATANITLRYYASEDTNISPSDELLGVVTNLQFIGLQVTRVINTGSAVTGPGFRPTWSGKRFIGVIWSGAQVGGTSCFSNDPDRTVVGTITTGCRCASPLDLTGRIDCFNGTVSCQSNEECFSDVFFLYGEWEKGCRPKTRLSGDISMGLATTVFTGFPRGYSFKAPFDITITSALVFGDPRSFQHLQIVKSPTQFAESTGVTTDAVTVFTSSGAVTGETAIPVNIRISQGEFVGILGYRGLTSTSILSIYSRRSEVEGKIDNTSIQVERFISQESSYPFSRFSIQTNGEFVARIALNVKRSTPFPTPNPALSPTFAPTPVATSCIQTVDFILSGSTYSSVDSGGGLYRNNINCYLVVPADQISFTSFSLEQGFDFLYIRQGNQTNFTRESANFTLTGDSISPSTFASTGGVLTLLFSTDASIRKPGWSFTATVIDPSLTPSPTTVSPTSSPATFAPTIPIQQLGAGDAVQFGGPSNYNATSFGLVPNNIQLREGIENHIIGSSNTSNPTVITCFHDAGFLNSTSTDFLPWTSELLDISNKTSAVKRFSPGFGLRFEQVILDFNYRRVGGVGGIEGCGEFRVQSLSISNSTIRDLYAGFRIVASGAVVKLENVAILTTFTVRKQARYIVYSPGFSADVTVSGVSIEFYHFAQGAFQLTGEQTTFTMINSTATRIAGSGQFLGSTDFLNALNASQQCSCSSSCFDTSNYCTYMDGSTKKWAFHALGFVDISANSTSSVILKGVQLSSFQGFTKGLALSLSHKDSTGVQTLGTSVEMVDISVSLSVLGDNSAPFFQVTSAPTATTSSPTASPILSKFTSSPTQSPQVSPVQAPTIVSSAGLPFVAGLAAFQGNMRRVVASRITYQNNFEPTQRVDTQRALLVNQADGVSFEISNVVIIGSELEAVVYDSGGNNTVQINTLSLQNLISIKLGSPKAVVLAENYPPRDLDITSATIQSSDHSLLYSIGSSLTTNQTDVTISIRDTTVLNSRPFHDSLSVVGTRESTSGIVALWIPLASGTSTCSLDIANTSFVDVQIGNALLNVGCTTTSVSLSSVNTTTIARTNTKNTAQILSLPSRNKQATLIVLDSVVENTEATGFAYLAALAFTATVNNSVLIGLRDATAFSLIDNVGTMSVTGCAFSTSHMPSVLLSSNLDVSGVSTQQRLTVTSSNFTANTGKLGALRGTSRNAVMDLTKCIFTNNSAATDLSEDVRAQGITAVESNGAAVSSEGAVTIRSTQFRNNSAANGGAIYAASLRIMESMFMDNRADSNAGDIVSPDVEVYDSQFKGSSAAVRGGSVWISTQFTSGFTTGTGLLSKVSYDSVKSDFGSVGYVDPGLSLVVFDARIERATAVDGTFFAADSSSISLTNATLLDVTSVDAGLLRLSINTRATVMNVNCSRFDISGFGGVVVAETNSEVDILSSRFREITVRADGGVLYLRSGSTVTMNDTIIEDVTASTGGLAYALGANLRISGCSVSKISSQFGAIFNSLSDASVSVQGTDFSFCKGEEGTFALVDQSSRIRVDTSTMSDFEASFSSAIARIGDSAEFVFTNSRVIGGRAATIGLFNVIGFGTLTLAGVNISRSQVSSGTIGIDVSENATFSATSCLFENSSTIRRDPIEPIGFIRLRGGCSGSIVSSRFVQNQGSLGASIVAIESAQMNISGCEFRGNKATQGSALYISTRSPVDVLNATISDNNNADSGAVFIQDSDVSFSRCKFDRNSAQSGGALIVRVQSKVRFHDCDFNNNVATNGGAGGALNVDNSSLIITQSRFVGNRATLGGAVALSSPSFLYILESIFRNNTAEVLAGVDIPRGGALSITKSANLTNLTIGGGSIFEHNEASGGAGGAIFWDQVSSRPLVLKDEGVRLLAASDPVAFSGNRAKQGSDIASSISKVTWTAERIVINPNSRLETAIFANVTDFYGNFVVAPVVVELIAQPTNSNDTTGTFVLGRLTTTTGTGCFGTRCPIPFQTAFLSQPNTNFTYRVAASSTFSGSDGSLEVVSVETFTTDLIVRQCRPGQIIVNDPSGSRCEDCPPGSFQPVTPTPTSQCLLCPFGTSSNVLGAASCPLCEGRTEGRASDGRTGATTCTPCRGNTVPNADRNQCDACVPDSSRTPNFTECACDRSFYYEMEDIVRNPVECFACSGQMICDKPDLFVDNVMPASGFWYDVWKGGLSFIECPRMDSCIGGSRDTSRACDRANGYEGVLCTECRDGYGRGGDEFTCVECQGLSITLLQIIGIFLCIVLVGIVVTYVNVLAVERIAESEDHRQESNEDAAVIVKILINFLQVNAIAASFDLRWPRFLQGLLDTESVISADLESLLFADCIPKPNIRIRPYYVNVLIVALLPFAIPILSLLTAGLFALRKKQSRANFDKLIEQSIKTKIRNREDKRQEMRPRIKPASKPIGNKRVPSGVNTYATYNRGSISNMVNMRGSISTGKEERRSDTGHVPERVELKTVNPVSEVNANNEQVKELNTIREDPRQGSNIQKLLTVEVKPGQSSARGEIDAETQGGVRRETNASRINARNKDDLEAKSVQGSIQPSAPPEDKESESAIPRSSAALVAPQDSKFILERVDEETKSNLHRRLIKYQYHASNYTLMFLIYPSLVRQTFNLFNCEKFSSPDESNRFVPDMGQQCWEEPHISWALGLGLPMLLFYVAGFPCLLLYKLYRHRDDIPMRWGDFSKLSVKQTFIKKRKTTAFHLVYDGYRGKYFCWEILILLRKVWQTQITSHI
ncbi:hypothetical protein AAMO2058_000790400 [Amorphochlora amoebiformis]